MGPRCADKWYVCLYNSDSLSLSCGLDGQYTCEVLPGGSHPFSGPLIPPIQDLTALPPRKRLHHLMPGFEVMNNAGLHTQNLGLQS